MDVISALLAFGAVVIVPLALSVIDVTDERARRLVRFARISQPVGAVAVMVSFLMPVGALAGAISAVWLIPCGVAGLASLANLIGTRSLRPAVLVPSAALGYLAIGALALVAFRFGWRPLGFSAVVVELTAVHYHFAGLGATAIAWNALRAAGGGRRRPAAIAAVVVVIATPMVAFGITAAQVGSQGAHVLEFVGALMFFASLPVVGALSFGAARRAGRALPTVLQGLALASVVVSMTLAVVYASGQAFGAPAPGISTMARSHGLLNAFGFDLAGLAGWYVLRRGA